MTRPVDPFAQGSSQGQAPQHYHPPQAYPSPPTASPPTGASASMSTGASATGASGTSTGTPAAGTGGGQSADGPAQGGGQEGGGPRPDQTAQLRPQSGGPPVRTERRPRTGAGTLPRTRKARLRVAKADPWSVMKVSFLLSIALGICLIVAVAVLWMVMDSMGVFSAIGDTISEATGTENESGFDLQAFLSLPRVLMFTAVIAVIDVVLATALATLGAFMYNLSAGFVGGVEVTLAEDE